MADRNYYVFCDDNCRFEGMTSEQILGAISEAVEEHGLRPITMPPIYSIANLRNGEAVQIWIGTQAEYEAVTPAENVLYIIAEHQAAKQDMIDDIETASESAETLAGQLEDFETALNGVKADYETAKRNRFGLKDILDAALRKTASVSELFDDAAEKQIEFAPIIEEYESAYPDIQSRAEAYKSQRDTMTSLWQSSEGEVIGVTGKEFTLSHGWQGYKELFFYVGNTYGTLGLDMNLITVRNSGETEFAVNKKYRFIDIYHSFADGDYDLTISFLDSGKIEMKCGVTQNSVKLFKIYGIGVNESGDS